MMLDRTGEHTLAVVIMTRCRLDLRAEGLLFSDGFEEGCEPSLSF